MLQVDTFTAKRYSLHWIDWVSQRRTPGERRNLGHHRLWRQQGRTGGAGGTLSIIVGSACMHVLFIGQLYCNFLSVCLYSSAPYGGGLLLEAHNPPRPHGADCSNSRHLIKINYYSMFNIQYSIFNTYCSISTTSKSFIITVSYLHYVERAAQLWNMTPALHELGFASHQGGQPCESHVAVDVCSEIKMKNK